MGVFMSKKKMFDLSVFDSVAKSEEGAVLELINPATGEPAINDDVPITITLKGSDSSVYQNHLQKILQQKAKDEANPKKKVPELDLGSEVRKACKLYAKMTIGWAGVPNENGDGFLEFSEDNAIKLYMHFKEIRKQVGDFIQDQANFIKA